MPWNCLVLLLSGEVLTPGPRQALAFLEWKKAAVTGREGQPPPPDQPQEEHKWKLRIWENVMLPACNPRTQVVEAGGCRVQGRPKLHNETLSQTNKQTNKKLSSEKATLQRKNGEISLSPSSKFGCVCVAGFQRDFVIYINKNLPHYIFLPFFISYIEEFSVSTKLLRKSVVYSNSR
jgi:hypothetical protein